jgi:hypothetical protein
MCCFCGEGQSNQRKYNRAKERDRRCGANAAMRSYGCAPERIKYVYNSPGLSRDQRIMAHPPGTPVGSGEIVMDSAARGSGA